MKPKTTYHPLDCFDPNTPKPGTPKYNKNFDDWYGDHYGFGVRGGFQIFVLILTILGFAVLFALPVLKMFGII